MTNQQLYDEIKFRPLLELGFQPSIHNCVVKDNYKVIYLSKRRVFVYQNDVLIPFDHISEVISYFRKIYV